MANVILNLIQETDHTQRHSRSYPFPSLLKGPPAGQGLRNAATRQHTHKNITKIPGHLDHMPQNAYC